MFLVFTGEEYYPGGGWNDYIGAQPSLETARTLVEAATGNDDWYQIVDSSTLQIVERGTIADTTTYDPYEEKRKAVPTDEREFPLEGK